MYFYRESNCEATVKISKWPMQPCWSNYFTKIEKSGFKKNAFKVWSLKFELIDRAQRALRGAAGKSLAEPFKKKILTVKPSSTLATLVL